MTTPSTNLQMFSTVNESGELRLELKEKSIPALEANQVLVRVEATPINPSDQGVMFGWSDISAATSSGEGQNTVLKVPVPEQGMRVMKARILAASTKPRTR